MTATYNHCKHTESGAEPGDIVVMWTRQHITSTPYEVIGRVECDAKGLHAGNRYLSHCYDIRVIEKAIKQSTGATPATDDAALVDRVAKAIYERHRQHAKEDHCSTEIPSWETLPESLTKDEWREKAAAGVASLPTARHGVDKNELAHRMASASLAGGGKYSVLDMKNALKAIRPYLAPAGRLVEEDITPRTVSSAQWNAEGAPATDDAYTKLYYAAEEALPYLELHPYGKAIVKNIQRCLQAIVATKLAKGATATRGCVAMDFFITQMFTVGRRIEAYCRQWILLCDLGRGCYLAVEPDAILPCPVQLIKVEQPAKEHTPPAKGADQ